MSKKQRSIVFLLVLIVLVLLAGCKEKESKKTSSKSENQPVATGNIEGTDNSSKKPEQKVEEDVDTSVEETKDSAELTALRMKIKENDCAVGIAFVDYVGNGLSEENVRNYLVHDRIVDSYPFLSQEKLIAYEGEELFALVPASKESTITLYPAGLDDEGNHSAQKDTILYQGNPGEPVLLRCNISENYGNVLAVVSNEEETLEFYPLISLEDGCSVAVFDGCYDFSLDNIRKYLDEAYYALEHNFTEVQEDVDNGMELVYAGEFYFCEQYMLRFEMGTYNEDGFVCEKQYAVGFDATYAFDTDAQKWYVIGAGLRNE